VAAALDLQRACAPDNGGGSGPRGRIGIHTGEARPADVRSYAQSVLQRGARLRDVAHAGQTLLTAVTASIVGDAVPGGAWLRDLGSHRLRDLSAPERIFELRHAELPDDFPPPRSLDVLANNLPPQLTSFVGRSQELAAVERLLGMERMVTLTGSADAARPAWRSRRRRGWRIDGPTACGGSTSARSPIPRWWRSSRPPQPRSWSSPWAGRCGH
jgi:hypothetical protein